MIELKGMFLFIYLMHKIIKYLGKNEKHGLMWIGVWVAAKDKGLIDTSKATDKFRNAIRKEVADQGAKVKNNGIVERADGRWYVGADILEDVIKTHKIGIVNLNQYKAEVEQHFPGTLDNLENDSKEDSKGDTSKGDAIAKETLISDVRWFMDRALSWAVQRTVRSEEFEPILNNIKANTEYIWHTATEFRDTPVCVVAYTLPKLDGAVKFAIIFKTDKKMAEFIKRDIGGMTFQVKTTDPIWKDDFYNYKLKLRGMVTDAPLGPKFASITDRLDSIADRLEGIDPKIAYRVDLISDSLEA